MKKIKYQGGITKLLASKRGVHHKSEFSKLVHDQEAFSALVNKVSTKIEIAVNAVSFSSRTDFPEQVLSILSFLRYVGTPSHWLIYSDGSHTRKETEILQTIFPFVEVTSLDWSQPAPPFHYIKPVLLPYQASLQHYAKSFPLGKRLFFYLNFEITRPTIFLDSDILFYEKADILRTIIQDRSEENGWFLPDVDWGCLDSRYKKTVEVEMYQANGGFMLLNQEFTKVEDGLQFLQQLGNTYEYFTEQTVMHILLTKNKFMPLDPRTFVINTGDQFDFSYLYDPEKIALRHYTGPVRHKMWQRDWKWHLSM